MESNNRRQFESRPITLDWGDFETLPDQQTISILNFESRPQRFWDKRHDATDSQVDTIDTSHDTPKFRKQHSWILSQNEGRR
jgi:hypothetical protein